MRCTSDSGAQRLISFLWVSFLAGRTLQTCQTQKHSDTIMDFITEYRVSIILFDSILNTKGKKHKKFFSFSQIFELHTAVPLLQNSKWFFPHFQRGHFLAYNLRR